MGYKDTEIIIKNYGKWIADTSTLAGYTTVNDWASLLSGVAKK
jgi:integrase